MDDLRLLKAAMASRERDIVAEIPERKNTTLSLAARKRFRSAAARRERRLVNGNCPFCGRTLRCSNGKTWCTTTHEGQRE